MTTLSSCSPASGPRTLVFWPLPPAFSFPFSPQCLWVSVWAGLLETPPLPGAFVPVAMCPYPRRRSSSLGLRRFSCASRKSLSFTFMTLTWGEKCDRSVRLSLIVVVLGWPNVSLLPFLSTTPWSSSSPWPTFAWLRLWTQASSPEVQTRVCSILIKERIHITFFPFFNN